MNLPAFKTKEVLAAIALVLPLGAIGMAICEQKVQAASETSRHLTDGLYLYGDTSRSNQTEHTYVVFEKDKDKVIGAFYAPYSEFSCFTGEQQGNQLKVKAVSSEDPQGVTAVAQLDKLHPINSYGANDQQILSICKQDASTSGL